MFAADLGSRKAAVLGATQRALSYFADTEGSGPAAWTSRPCWYLVGLEDRAIPPAAQQFMARRACDHVREIHSAHDSLITHAGDVDQLIMQAADSIG